MKVIFKNKIKKLLMNKGFMLYFKNTSWLLAEKILRLFVGIFVGVWIARFLGPEKFGLFSYAQSFVGLFAVTATLGLDGIVVRELIKNNGSEEGIIGTAFLLKFFGAIFSIILLFIVVNLISMDNYTKALFFIISSSNLFQAFNVIDFYFQSKVLSRYIVYANSISLFVSSIFKILLILNNGTLLSFAWIILFDSIILSLGFMYYFYKKTSINISKILFSKQIAISLLKDSWPLFLSGIIISIYMKIDQVIIKSLLTSNSVGQYAAATRLSEAWYFIPMVIASSLFPAIVNAKSINEELYCSRLQNLYSFMVWMSISIALPMTFFSKKIILLIYGQQYIEAGDVLTIHIWTGVFVFLGVAFSGYLSIENQTKKAFFRTLLGAILNILLNYLLIPIYGIKGSAFATLLGQFFSNYFYDILDKDLKKQLIMKSKAFFPIYLFNDYKKIIKF